MTDIKNEAVKQLLIVEDDEVFASVTARALGRRGFGVDIANTLEQAHQVMHEKTFQYAIIDLNLAGQSSLELIPPLRERFPQARLLMLTGYASIATAVEAIKLGADNYLAKPADIDEILAALEDEHDSDHTDIPFQEPMSVRRLEWEHIQKVLMENNGNISETARQLKMHRRTLQRKLQKNRWPVKPGYSRYSLRSRI